MASKRKKIIAVTAPATQRAEHLRHETAIQMVGLLYFAAALGALAAGVTVAVLTHDEDTIRVAILFGLLSIGFGYSGWLLRRLDTRARYTASLLAVIALMALPIGTVLGGYVLYLVHSKKGRTILSPEYREVIAATPEFQCRVANSALALGIGLVGFAIYNVVRVFLLTHHA
jgi:hypothetical protein